MNCFFNCAESAHGTALVAESVTQQTANGNDVELEDDARSISLKEQMDAVLKQSMSQSGGQTVKKNLDKAVAAAIKTEMAVFESNRVRGRSLELVYNYLMTIPSASVESERAFSAAGTLCSKIRSRLDDRSLDALCIIRSYYKHSKNAGHQK